MRTSCDLISAFLGLHAASNGTTLRKIPKKRRSQLHRGGSLISRLVVSYRISPRVLYHTPVSFFLIQSPE